MKTPIVLCVADQSFQTRWDFCLQSQEAYASRFGYRYVLKETPVEGLNLKWSKLAYAAEYLEADHPVLLIDADAEIRDSAPDFQAELNPKLTGSILYVNGVSGRPNSGVLMLSGIEAHCFLLECIKERNNPVEASFRVTASGENGHVISVLAQKRYEVAARELPVEWNCSQPELAGNAHIRHYTNNLRKALFGGTFQDIGNTPYPPSSEQNAALRLVSKVHRVARQSTARAFDNDPQFARSFRNSVNALSSDLGLCLPAQFHDDGSAWLWNFEFLTGLLDLPSRTIWENMFRPGSIVFDGGAHIGYFSQSCVERAAKLISVEPNESNFDRLVRNLPKQAICVPAAIGDRDGSAVLNEGRGHTNSTLFRLPEGTGRSVPVVLRSIDSICSEYCVEKVDLLKLDVEGYEPEAIAGASDTISSSQDIVILVEINPRLLGARGLGPEAVLARSSQHGLIPRRVNADFSLGPAGVVNRSNKADYVLARKSRWVEILDGFKR